MVTQRPIARFKSFFVNGFELFPVTAYKAIQGSLSWLPWTVWLNRTALRFGHAGMSPESQGPFKGFRMEWNLVEKVRKLSLLFDVVWLVKEAKHDFSSGCYPFSSAMSRIARWPSPVSTAIYFLGTEPLRYIRARICERSTVRAGTTSRTGRRQRRRGGSRDRRSQFGHSLPLSPGRTRSCSENPLPIIRARAESMPDASFSSPAASIY
jgi:hypothetical protein